jgi:hypothetical protein
VLIGVPVSDSSDYGIHQLGLLNSVGGKILATSAALRLSTPASTEAILREEPPSKGASALRPRELHDRVSLRLCRPFSACVFPKAGALRSLRAAGEVGAHRGALLSARQGSEEKNESEERKGEDVVVLRWLRIGDRNRSG